MRTSWVSVGLLSAAVTLGVAAPASAQRPAPLQPGLLRVCADPDNMPFSNQKGEGYENKIADLIAKSWDSKLQYVWWPIRRGYFRMLNGTYCDVVIESPAGLDMAGATKPYYRSGYVFVSQKGSGLEDINSLSDPRLKKLRIGVNLFVSSDGEHSPPEMALSSHGVVGNLKGYTVSYDENIRPEDIINGVAKKEVDVAIVWGPQAGYFVKRSPVPLVMTPISVDVDSASGFPMRYNVGMAIRRRDHELRDSLQAFLAQHESDIQTVLKEYSVPTFPIPAEQEKGEKKTTSAETPKPAADSAKVAGRQ
ncbi:MAG TPA: quinoprotein dehydrogenase-associated putative ABC transporter substrate-binding protein [Gemmatimonadales bacterium]